jgi:hypothetical protein
MQVLVLAVQNAVPYSELGVATSAATLFRSIGGSLGTAILGAIFANRLAGELAGLPHSAAAAGLTSGQVNPEALKALPASLHDRYVHSFTDSLSTVFLIAAIVVAIAFLLAWLLEERPLRKTIEERDVGDAFAAPQQTDSLGEITRELGRLVGRERTRRFIEGVVERAGVDLGPAEAWLLSRADGGRIAPDCLAQGDDERRRRLRDALRRLQDAGLVAPGEAGPALTEAGRRTRSRLMAARCGALTELVADWEPEDPQLDDAIARLAQELGDSRGDEEPDSPGRPVAAG